MARRRKNVSDKPTRTKKARTPRSESKAAFVRAHAFDTPARAVIAAAKEKGLHLSAAYVYAIRSRSAGGGPSATRGPGRRTSNGHAPANAERALVQAIVDVGTARARQVLDHVEREIRNMMLAR